MTCHTSPTKCNYPDCACPPDRTDDEASLLREQIDLLLNKRRAHLEAYYQSVKRQIGIR